MGRKKKIENEVENTAELTVESEQEEAEALEATEVAEFLNEDSSEEETKQVEASEDETKAVEASEEEKEEEPKAAPKPRRRRNRKKPAPVAANPLLGMGQPVEPTDASEAAAMVAEPVKAPAPIEMPKTYSTNYIREDAAVAEVSIHQSMDSMVKQWAAVKEISNGVCTNLEKVVSTLQQLQTNYSNATQELSRPEFLKAKANNRMVISAAIASIVLSVLSLTMSQSTRQTVMEQFAFRKTSASAVADNSSTPSPFKAEPKDFPRATPPKELAISKTLEAAPRRRESPAVKDAHKEWHPFHDAKTRKK